MQASEKQTVKNSLSFEFICSIHISLKRWESCTENYKLYGMFVHLKVLLHSKGTP